MSENMQTCPECQELVPIEYVICVWCGYNLSAEHIKRAGIVIGRREIVQRVVKLTKDPINAFKEIALIPDLKGPRYIMYFIGVFMTLNMIAVFKKLDGLSYNTEKSRIVLYQGRISPSIPVTSVISLVFLIIQPLILLFVFNLVWKVGTRIVILLTRTLGGKGDKLKIRSAIGYSLTPVLFGWAFSWLVRLVTPSTSVSDTSYTGVEDAIVTVTKHGIGVVSTVVLYICWIWATILATIGVSKVSRISYIEAFIAAGIPFLFFMSIVN